MARQTAFIVTMLILAASGCQTRRSEEGRAPTLTLAVLADAGTTMPATPTPTAHAARSQSAPSSACPEDMTLIEGMYCPEVEHTCLEWLDPPGSRYEHFRCARYAKTATCKAPRVRKRFCIETTEHREPDSELPVHKTSWSDATRLCSQTGGRVCAASEWQFACEGEEMRPYPYGWERDSSACNVDVSSGLGRVGRLVDHRAPASAHPRCVSAFGVHGMAGNVDEWVTVEGQPIGTREVMKGSWWIPGRHACRSYQGGHGAHYGGTETGVRCCRDAPSSYVTANANAAHN